MGSIVNCLFFFSWSLVVSPKVTLAEKFFVSQGKSASVICQVEGNPKPTVSWSHCDLPNVICDKQYLNISKVQTARANYSCTATNALGVDSATTLLSKWTLLCACSSVISPQNCIKWDVTKSVTFSLSLPFLSLTTLSICPALSMVIVRKCIQNPVQTNSFGDHKPCPVISSIIIVKGVGCLKHPWVCAIDS